MSWLTQRDTHETMSVVGALMGLLQQLGGPLTKRLVKSFEDGDLLSVIEYKFDYDDPSLETDDLIYARQVQALLNKQDFLDLGCDREHAALVKFAESEARCRITNERFRKFASDGIVPSDVGVVLFHAQRKIAEILGRLPTYGELDFAFGPGANTSVKAAVANAKAKLSARLECSTSLFPVLGEFLSEFPLWSCGHAFITKSDVRVKLCAGKLQFVPKDARIHRPIVVEPILNSLYQKGFGSYMKKRLRKFGVDLADQTRNQDLAYKGSVDGSLATLDLSSASDCVARELVWSLLPIDWAEALERGRTPHVEYRGELILLEKFSSMGNAFTFELESLIFYSLANGVCKCLGLPTESVSVYGDDIIVPVAAYGLMTEVLDYCGFEINLKKSYASGPFRESCGADWFRGISIRPFYLREKISDRSLFVMHNFFVRNGEYQLAKLVSTFIRPHNKTYGPDGYGDGHLIGTYTLRSSRKLRRAGYEGGFFDTFVCVPKRLKLARPNDWVYPVYSVYVRSGSGDPSDPDIIRGTRGYRRVSIYTLARRVFSEPVTL